MKYGDVHDGGIPSDGVAPFWGVGATMKFPLFTGFRIQNQIKEAGHHKGETEEELQNLANEIVLQIVRAYLARITNAEQIALEQERVTFAKEAMLLAEERYRLGLSPTKKTSSTPATTLTFIVFNMLIASYRLSEHKVHRIFEKLTKYPGVRIETRHGYIDGQEEYTYGDDRSKSPDETIHKNERICGAIQWADMPNGPHHILVPLKTYFRR